MVDSNRAPLVQLLTKAETPICHCAREAEQARRTLPRPQANERIREALAETNDAVEMLTGGPLRLYPDAVKNLEEAARLEQQALNTGSRVQRNASLGQAIRLKQETSALMLN
jgi:hypothetical protein